MTKGSWYYFVAYLNFAFKEEYLLYILVDAKVIFSKTSCVYGWNSGYYNAYFLVNMIQ